MGSSTDPKVALLKPEGAYGVDAVPSPVTDALLIADEVRAPQLQAYYAERRNAKAFFGKTAKLIAGQTMNVGFDVELAGAGIAGTAPGWGKAVRCCAMAEKLLAAADAGTAQAGAANTITLAVGASAVDGTYVPLRIRITSGTGVGQTRVITGYVGATKVATVTPAWTTPPDATSDYSIDAMAAYSPISSAIESGTIYFYYGDAVHKLLGARGELGCKFPNMDRPMLSLDYQGIYGGIVDAAFPAVTLSSFQDVLPVNNANTSLVSIHDYAARVYNLEGKLGNAVKYRNLPGVEEVFIFDRDPTGSLEIEKPLIADKDFPAILLGDNGAPILGQVSLTHGTVVGNKVGIDGIQVQLTNHRYGNRDNVVTDMLDMDLVPGPDGNNELVIYAL
jgi:hypothetical protein